MDTETYLAHVKSDYSRRVAAGFIACFVLFVLAGILAYLSVHIFSRGTVYALTSPVEKGSAGGVIRSILACQLLNAVALFVLFFSVFTVMNRWITALLCIWKGVAFGVDACLIMKGTVRGISDHWTWSLAVFFIASVLIVALAAVSRVYSDVICYTFAADERRYTASLAMEYVKLFLLISGGIFLLGAISTILI